MERHLLIDVKNDLFQKSWKLYNEAFPVEERRDLDYHVEAMAKPEFRCEAYSQCGEFVGFLFWWQLSGVRYIEHFATSTDCRGKGYGAQILKEFIDSENLPVFLEVEHPLIDINCRRIDFYQRFGFSLCQWNYVQPPYDVVGGESLSLLTMTTNPNLSQSEWENIVSELYKTVHFRY